MLNPEHPLARLLAKDRRYKLEAYALVSEAMEYAHNVLGMGSEQPSEPDEGHLDQPKAEPSAERHLTGQQLCEAVRQYALEQYGYLAKTVLNSWGIYSTSDIGNIVYNLIEIGQMRKTQQDRREDFDGVFDFDEGLTQSFRIEPPRRRGR
jgi:uncharacterized repeat protein (TIGR04138 family)